MTLTKQCVQATQTQEKNFMVIDFLELDPKKIKFQDVKPQTNGSKLVPSR